MKKELRYADIHLLLAEAITITAGTVQQQSLDMINDTRGQTGLTDLTMAEVPDMTAFVEAILALKLKETSYWDITKASTTGGNIDEVWQQMLPGVEH